MSSKTIPEFDLIVRKGTLPKKITLRTNSIKVPKLCRDILMAVAEELEAKFPSLQDLKPVIEYEYLFVDRVFPFFILLTFSPPEGHSPPYTIVNIQRFLLGHSAPAENSLLNVSARKNLTK